MKILVVDDEDSVRELVRNAMVEQGYQVWVAANGRHALDLGGEFKFDLVFCDVVMDGLSGFEVLKTLRGTLRSQAEIVLMTGQASVEVAIEAVQHGANDYICKPFSIGVLQAIASAVEQRRYPSKLAAIESSRTTQQEILGNSPAMIRVASVMNDVIPEGEMPTLEQLESSYMLKVLSAVGGNKSRAAQVMGVDRKTLYRMIDRQVNTTPENRKVS